jgi:fructosamine-3-kinase
MPTHPLRQPATLAAIEAATSAHRGAPWTVDGFTDLHDLASHPAGILRGGGYAVFAKLLTGPDADAQAAAELAGHALIRQRGGVATPRPVGAGALAVPGGTVLLLEAVAEVPPPARRARHWRLVGRALARLHRTRGEMFGLAGQDGYFGPLRQDNRPVHGDRWCDFFAGRRLLPHLRLAVDSGHLPAGVAAGVHDLVPRLGELCGPEPAPTLLHGDAQANNLLTTGEEAVLIDACPYFGHPEVDLAQVDIFAPVPGPVLDAYRAHAEVDEGFAGRRELWRLPAYLAVVTVDGASRFGRPFVGRIADAVARYR